MAGNYIRHDFAKEYVVALAEFKELRKRLTRKAFDGRDFILVPRLTERLKTRSPSCTYQNDLERLRIVSHHRSGASVSITSEKLGEYLQVFYILLDLECPHLIHRIARPNMSDKSLPFHDCMLRFNINDLYVRDIPNFYEDFLKCQYDWCPIMFDLHMGEDYEGRVVPAYFRTQLELRKDSHRSMDSDTKVYRVEIPDELIGDKLRKKLPNAKFERDPGTELDPHAQNAGAVSDTTYPPIQQIAELPASLILGNR